MRIGMSHILLILCLDHKPESNTSKLYFLPNRIIYRDTKPENIGFDVRGTAKVFDFGLSKELLDKDKIRTDQYKASGRTGMGRLCFLNYENTAIHLLTHIFQIS